MVGSRSKGVGGWTEMVLVILHLTNSLNMLLLHVLVLCSNLMAFYEVGSTYGTDCREGCSVRTEGETV